jgi:hypothetical protein
MMSVHVCRDAMSKLEVFDDPHAEVGRHVSKEAREMLQTVCEELGLPFTAGPSYKKISLSYVW